MQYSFTLRTIYPYLGDLWSAAGLTLSLSVLAIVISIVVGAGVAVMRRGGCARCASPAPPMSR